MATYWLNNVSSVSVEVVITADATNDYYRVYVRDTSGTAYWDRWYTISGTTAKTVTVTGLSPGTNYVANVAYNTAQSATGATWIGAQEFTTDDSSGGGDGDYANYYVTFDTGEFSYIRLQWTSENGDEDTTFYEPGTISAEVGTIIEIRQLKLADSASPPVYCRLPDKTEMVVKDEDDKWQDDEITAESGGGTLYFYTGASGGSGSTANCVQCYINFDTANITRIDIKHYATDDATATTTTRLDAPGYITAQIGSWMEVYRLYNESGYGPPIYCVLPDGTYQEIVDENDEWANVSILVPTTNGTFLFTADPSSSGSGPAVTVELGQGINSVEVYYVSSETNGGNQDIIMETTTFHVNTNYDMQIKSIRLRDNYKHPVYCVGDTTWQMTDEDGSFLDPYLQSLSDGKNFQLYATESTGEGGVYISGQYYEAYIYANGAWLKHDCYICTNETNGTMEVTRKQ